MSYQRAGFDVTEAMFIKEVTFGTTPITGADKWRHFGNNLLFDPVKRPVFKPRVGLGAQKASALTLAKEFAELSLEAEILKKSAVADAEYEFCDFFALAWGEDANAATIDLEKHIASMSIGAKLAVTTPEYILCKGSKFESAEIKGSIEDPIRFAASVIAQKYSYGTTDYVSGTPTRKNFPATDRIMWGDIDFWYGGSSLLDKIASFDFSMRRDMEKRGSNATTKTLYGKFAESGLSMEIAVALDFDSMTQLTDFLNETPKEILIKLPLASGGRIIALPDCKWREMRKPLREQDLIELSLTADVLGTPTITTAA